jgi:solute:Na+ symporter, SSS family
MIHELSLGIVDWLIIALYFVFILGIGFYLKGFADTGKGFFLGGRKNSAWVAGLAFLSANLGALELLGWTGGTMKYGMYAAHFYWIGAIPAMLFLGLYMMPFYYSSRIHSVPGYLKLRFDERTRILNAISFAIMTILMSGINLYAMALVLRTFLGWNWDACMWASAVTVACYVTMGGLLSAIFTEIIQFFLIWFGLFLVAILGFVEIGGPTEVMARMPETMTHLWSNSGDATANAMEVTFSGIILGLGFVLSFGYWTTDFLVVQRAFSSKDLRTARLTPILAAFFKMLLPIIVIGAGMVAYALWKDPTSGFQLLQGSDGSPDYNSALPLLIQRYYPTGLMGLGVTALLAGFMAGQAGNVTAFNTVWTYDIYKAVFNKDASDSHLVWVGRVTTIVGILLSVATAYITMQFETIMDYVQAIFSWVNAPLFATMLLGMFWKRCTSTAAFWGLLAGMLVSFMLFLLPRMGLLDASLFTFSDNPSDMTRNLWQAWWAWMVTFGLTIGISFVTTAKSDHELQGLVKGLTGDTESDETGLLSSPGFWAIIALVALIGLNLYFW